MSLNPETYEPMIITIDMVKPKGICGSGLINILAAMMEADIISPNGKFRDDLNTPRIRQGDEGREFVLAMAPDTQSGQDITLSEADIDNLMRAKGAMFAGYVTLLENVGLKLEDLEQVILAGAFGNFINIDNAITIGLLARSPPGKLPVRGQRLPPGRLATGLLPGTAGGGTPGGRHDDQFRALRNPGLHGPVHRRPVPAPHQDGLLPQRRPNA